ICLVSPCQGKEFASTKLLLEHKQKAHRHRCELGCKEVGYESLRDLRSRHYGPQHKAETGPYRCGRCGKQGFRHDNHARHLGRKSSRPCRALPAAQEYLCGRCGHQTFNKEEHLRHLHRRGCDN
ncbi:hypothetical protein GQ607_014485, partial [Colletotrichum asianum]